MKIKYKIGSHIEEESILAGYHIVNKDEIYFITDNLEAFQIHKGILGYEDGFIDWCLGLKSTDKCLKAKEGNIFKGYRNKKCFRLTKDDIKKLIEDKIFTSASVYINPNGSRTIMKTGDVDKVSNYRTYELIV